jgi:parallel beta-helix repeat protein
MKNVSWMLLAVLLVSTFALAFYVRTTSAQAETIYINSNGSVTPFTAPISSSDNIIYTFIRNISYPTYNGIEVDRSNIVIDGNGYTVQGSQSGNGITLTGVTNVVIKNVNVQHFDYGICLSYSDSYDKISGINATANSFDGILLYYCSNNVVTGCNATSNTYHGIELYASSNNIVSNSTETDNIEGIILTNSSNNTLSGNNATSNSLMGISLCASNNTVTGNTVTANSKEGIDLYYSSNNNVSGNNLTANPCGIVLTSSSNNTLVHNNFMNNTSQVSSSDSVNVWDDGYPSSGNYWSDYSGADLFNSIYQNVTGSDGIGDTPYIIDPYTSDLNFCFDNYPLMNPWPYNDVAIDTLAATPTEVRKGDSCFIDLTVANIGDFDETFNVTVYANMTITASVMTIVTYETVTLNGHDSAMLTFIWDTSGFEPGNYTLSAIASPIPGETNVADNTFVTSPMQIVPLMTGGGEANGMKCPSFSERA